MSGLSFPLTDDAIHKLHDLKEGAITYVQLVSITRTGPRSAVGNMSGNRCEQTTDSGVVSSIPAGSHTFVEIDHELIPTVILLPSAEPFKKGCCHLQRKVCARITG